MPLKMMGGSEIQNRFMLMKFIFKLFSHGPAPWKNWILRDAVAFDTPSNGSSSYLWQIIDDELMTYRSVTYVNVLNGASTSFGLMIGSLKAPFLLFILLCFLTPSGLMS